MDYEYHEMFKDRSLKIERKREDFGDKNRVKDSRDARDRKDGRDAPRDPKDRR